MREIKMSLLKRENPENKSGKIIIDFSSELEEMCLDCQKEMQKKRSDFRDKLNSSILVLKNEIDNAALMNLKEMEEVNKYKDTEIEQLQTMVNEMVRELEICNRTSKKKIK